MKYFMSLAVSFALSLSLLFSLNAQDVCSADDPTYFCLPPDKILNNELNEVNFYLIPNKVITLFYDEIINSGGSIQLDAHWESPFFGAGVSFNEGVFHLMIFGGTARIAGMTEDAYAAVACHEVAHIVGGEPRQTMEHSEWSSSEGQADYFAASVCLPHYFKSLGVIEGEIAARVEKAGFEMINSFKEFNPDVLDRILVRSFVNLSETNETLINAYPTLQCRYENFRDPSRRPGCWFKKL